MTSFARQFSSWLCRLQGVPNSRQGILKTNITTSISDMGYYGDDATSAIILGKNDMDADASCDTRDKEKDQEKQSRLYQEGTLRLLHNHANMFSSLGEMTFSRIGPLSKKHSDRKYQHGRWSLYQWRHFKWLTCGSEVQAGTGGYKEHIDSSIPRRNFSFSCTVPCTVIPHPSSLNALPNALPTTCHVARGGPVSTITGSSGLAV